MMISCKQVLRTWFDMSFFWTGYIWLWNVKHIKLNKYSVLRDVVERTVEANIYIIHIKRWNIWYLDYGQFVAVLLTFNILKE